MISRSIFFEHDCYITAYYRDNITEAKPNREEIVVRVTLSEVEHIADDETRRRRDKYLFFVLKLL